MVYIRSTVLLTGEHGGFHVDRSVPTKVMKPDDYYPLRQNAETTQTIALGGGGATLIMTNKRYDRFKRRRR